MNKTFPENGDSFKNYFIEVWTKCFHRKRVLIAYKYSNLSDMNYVWEKLKVNILDAAVAIKYIFGNKLKSL